MGVWENDVWRLLNSSRAQIDSINIVLGAYRSIRQPVAYTSMPITSGERFYDVLNSYGVSTIDKLVERSPDALYNEIIKPNVEEGIAFSDKLQGKIGLPNIAPSVFEAKKQRWTQDEYMYMWFRVMEERMLEHYLKPAWEKSNGGADEFVRSLEMQFGFINPKSGMEFIPEGVSKKDLYERMEGVKVYGWSSVWDMDSMKEMNIEDGAWAIANGIRSIYRMETPFEPFSLLRSLDQVASIAQDVNKGGEFLRKPYDFDEKKVLSAFDYIARSNDSLVSKYVEGIKKRFPNRYGLSEGVRDALRVPFGIMGGSYQSNSRFRVE